MKYILAFLLLVPGAFAQSSLSAVTISKTLTLTRPTAYISMTGVSATAYLTKVSSTNVSTTNLSIGSTNISTSLLPIATGYISTTASTCTVLKSSGISGCTRLSAGVYGVSLTTPTSDALYKVNCTLDSYQAASWVATASPARANNTTGFYMGVLNGSGVVAYQDSNRFMCVVYP